MRVMYRAEYIYIERELKQLENAFFEKAYFHGYVFRLKFNKGSISFMPPIRANLTYIIPPQIKEHPLSSILRKELKGKKLVEIKVVNKDRFIELDFGEKKLYLEMFGKGNAVLTENKVIKYALNYGEFKDRTIKKGEEYKLPNLLSLDYENLINKFKEKTIGQLLGTIFGKHYSDYLLFKHKIDKDEKVNKNTLEEMIKFFYENATPYLFVDNDFGVLPFKEVKESGKELSFYVDNFYKHSFKSKKLEKLKKAKEELEMKIKEYERKAEEYKKIGDWIYEHYVEIEELIKKAKEGKVNVNKKDKSFDITI